MADSKAMRAKLEKLQELVVDGYIEAFESGKIHPRDFAPIMTLLNQNKVTVSQDEGETQHSKVKRLMKKDENVAR